MADPIQDNPPAGKVPEGEGVGRAADHTSGKPGDKASIQVLQDLGGMIVRTNDWLAYKERLMLAYVSERFPKPFYICWRDEANAVVRQVVGMRRRQRLIEQRRRGEAAAKASSAPAAKR